MNTPPKYALRLLQMFLRRELCEEVEGDLQERFENTVRSRGKTRAQLNYWYQVIHYVRPFALRKSRPIHTTTYAMYRSYLITSLRNMARSKLHALINISGLSIGMAVTFAIALWIWDELSFEKGYPNNDRIAQVIQNVTNNGQVDTWKSVPWPLAQELRDNYGDDFQHVVLTSGMYQHMLASDSVKMSKEGVFAEPAFSSMFSLELLSGTHEAISDPSALFISQSTATAFFGGQDPIGRIMTIDQEMTVHVRGVFRDLPPNSRFGPLQFVAGWQLLYNNTDWIRNMNDPWRPNAFETYVMLKEHGSFERVSARIKDAKLKKVDEELAKKKPKLLLHPMTDWHLRSEFRNGIHAGGRIQYVWLFGVVGGFVILMACINFMNLSTARSEKRAKEVGIRKAIGSIRRQLVSQYLTESVLTTFLSLLIAILLVQLFLPAFNTISEKQIAVPWSNFAVWAYTLSSSLIIGLLAGSYPALYLSSLGTIKVLKGIYRAGPSASAFRKVLVIVQFTISVTLIVGTVVVFRQVQHARNRPIGYDTSGLISVPLTSPNLRANFNSIREELIANRIIVNMGKASAPTTQIWSTSSAFDWNGKDPDLSVDFPNTGVSYDYGETIGWEIIAGRSFSSDFLTDSSAVILNKAAVEYMGLKNPLGETIRWYQQPLKVIGIVGDIVARSPYEPVPPTIYYLSNDEYFAVIRLNPAHSATESIRTIEAVCKPFSQGEPFNYTFIDEEYENKFSNEQRIGTLSTIFASLAIFISCLGIFGLASFVAEQRTKEIGVRKVMGASVFDLWRLMSKDFVVLVVVSCLIAAPVAYQVLSHWLERFTYRVEVPFWVFAFASAGTLLITLLTISFHTLAAATLNPAKSLRTE